MRPCRILQPLAALALACFAQPALGADAEVSQIELIRTRDYDPNDEHGRRIKRFFSGIGVALVGPNKDLKKELLTKLNNEALKEYFPDAAEREALATRIAAGMHSRFLDNGYNNRNIVGALRYATSELIVNVVKRVLKKEGLTDNARAGLWSGKILASYHACMNSARTYKEAGKCGEAVEADLVANMGMAMTYELTRQSFGAPAARGSPREFVACVRPQEQGTETRVKDCALKGVKKGAKEFGRASILAVAKKEVNQATAQRIVAKVMPEFERCIDASGDRTGFVKCGDKLIGKAGAELAYEAIMADTRIAGFFPKPEDRARIATTGRDSFARCMAENERNNRRDTNGTLKTDNCETFVKMETARTVVFEVLRTTLEKNLAGVPAEERARLLREVTAKMAACWNSAKPEAENAPCLREATKELAVAAAKHRLDKELPADVVAIAPGLRDELLAVFKDCLEQRLPANLMAANNAEERAQSCAVDLAHEAALRIAEIKIRGALKDTVTDGDAIDRMVGNLVREAFSSCLGRNPSPAKLDECSLKLQKNVASTVAQVILPARVDAFFREGGGLAAYGLDEAKKNELVASVVASNKQCLRTGVRSTDTNASSAEITTCLKQTIRELSLKLGPLEFARMARENEIPTQDASFRALNGEFAREFGTCLDEKKGPEHPLSVYLKQLDDCQARLSRSYTVKVAKAELGKVLSQVFTDASSAPERERLEGQLFSDFDACMERSTDARGRDACVKKLKSDATMLLARAGVRARAVKDLGELPQELKDFEAELDRCVAAPNANGEDCTRTYLKASTTVIGKKLLHKKLREQLGARFDSLAEKIKPLEESFAGCVAQVSGTVNQAFLEKLDSCGNKLGDAVVDFVLENPPTEQPPAGTATSTNTNTSVVVEAVAPAAPLTEKQLADMMSRAVLCLNGQLTNETESSLDNIDPESMEAELLKLIGAYVSYDLRAAHGRFEEVLPKLGEDLKAAGPESARRKLLDSLVQGGFMDQMLRSIVHGELEKALRALPADKRPSPDLEKALLDKSFLTRVLAGDTLSRIRPAMATGVLEPVLVGGATIRSSGVLRAMRGIKSQSFEALLAHPDLARFQSEAAFQQLKDALK